MKKRASVLLGLALSSLALAQTAPTTIIKPSEGLDFDAGGPRGNAWVADESGQALCRLLGTTLGGGGTTGNVKCSHLEADGRLGASSVTPVIEIGRPETRMWMDINEDGLTDFVRVVQESGSWRLKGLLQSKAGPSVTWSPTEWVASGVTLETIDSGGAVFASSWRTIKGGGAQWCTFRRSSSLADHGYHCWSLLKN